ncbi:MAG: DUF935 family protein [Kiritimatiellaeota bacterium]|nr:DUF935 family protein [Kiritimatiellota bacterium]
MPRLVTLLEAGERGQYADLQWFYHYMERSDAMVFAVMQRRRAALLACDWDIRQVAEASGHRSEVRSQKEGRGAARLRSEDGTTPGRSGAASDRRLAEEQAACLREAYDGIENLRDAVGFIFSAFFRGFGHLEKHFDPAGMVTRLEPVEQWFWVRDGLFGAWEYNENAVSGRWRGVGIETANFLIFETVALNRIIAIPYLRKNLCEKDWDGFLEVYGVPSVFLVGPPNTPEAKEAEYQKIAEEIISDGRGFLPNGSDVKYVNGGGNRPPFLERIEYLDRQITVAATGGLLTMLAQSGSGTLAGGAHMETFRQIARGDAAMLSEVFQQQFDLPLLAEFFPGEPVLAYFEFAPAATDEASRVVEDAVELTKAGVRVDPEELSEKTGYQLKELKPESGVKKGSAGGEG